MSHTNPPCTATNPKTNRHVDLSPLRRTKEDGHNWFIKDDNSNRSFSINICAPVIENTTSVQGIDPEHIGAIYVDGDEMFSIGEPSSHIYFQGDKIVLQYKNGSLCPGNTTFRKSTTISFICDPHMHNKPLIFFIADVDTCAYFFELHTAYACLKTYEEHLINPGAVFGIMLLIAFIVYCIGGCIYRSNVTYATGWKRIPHYRIFYLIKDAMFILFSTVCSKLPTFGFLRPNYSYIEDIDEENRLIDDVFIDD